MPRWLAIALTILLGFALMIVGVILFVGTLMSLVLPPVREIGLFGGLCVFGLGLFLVVRAIRLSFAGRFAGPS